jgi:hypothetical protein
VSGPIEFKELFSPSRGSREMALSTSLEIREIHHAGTAPSGEDGKLAIV